MIDASNLSKVMNNVVKYAEGFLVGVDTGRIAFNKTLGKAMTQMLYEYIDMAAESNPKSLHHVYEPGMVGDPRGRLFKLQYKASINSIYINGNFLESRIPSRDDIEPFIEKARLMEGGIAITADPAPGGVLAFMDDGELVISSRAITIEHPGGPEVEGSFARTVDTFLRSYLTKAVVEPAMQRLSTPQEYSTFFKQGARLGSIAGIRAGKKFMQRGAHESI